MPYQEQQIEKEKIENKSKINQNTKSPYSTSPSLRSGVTLLEQLVKSHPIWFLPHLDRQSASHLLRHQEPGVCFFLIFETFGPNSLGIYCSRF